MKINTQYTSSGKKENGILKVVEINCSVTDASNEQNNKLPFHKMHCIIKATQSSYFEEVENNIGNNKMTLQVNFAETYSAVSQDEIQIAHCTYPQIIILIFFAWLKGNAICSFLVSKRLTSAL